MKLFKILAITLIMGFSSSVMAQGWFNEPPPDDNAPFGKGPRHEKIRKRIETIKIWKLTEKLDLTSEQSEKFFPIYNRFEADRDSVLDEKFTAFGKLDSLLKLEDPPEKDIFAALDKLDSFEGKVQGLRKKFRNDLKGILTTKQLGELYVFEMHFMREIRQIIRDARREMHDRPSRKDKQ